MKTLISIWNNEKYRGYLYQSLVLMFIIWGCYTLYSNASYNLEQQKIASGFDFLDSRASFDIGETLIKFTSADKYSRALLVGALNTVYVSFVGIIVASIAGLLICLMRLSGNWLLSRIAYTYTEVSRNTPLLLQLFFIYAIFTVSFPDAKVAEPIFGSLYLTNRGVFYPQMDSHFVWDYFILIFLAGIVVASIIRKILKKHHEKTGHFIPYHYLFFLLPVVFVLIAWVLGGMPTSYTSPVFEGFNFKGGSTHTPEFMALLGGLVFHTSAYIAEVIRSGIESVGKGQVEASRALGLKPGQTMSLVVLPQAMRVIIPPYTNQMLNLTKNSTLAVGIGYPDFVSVANTTINQTGQAIEGVAMIMALYLFFSVITSLFMNWFNKKVALVER